MWSPLIETETTEEVTLTDELIISNPNLGQENQGESLSVMESIFSIAEQKEALFQSGCNSLFIKKAFEIILLAILIIPCFILISIIALLLIIPNKGKVVFKQERVGLGCQKFSIYKFRTLKKSIEIPIEKDENLIKENAHAVGLFLRKTGLDEILQIVNVLKGDMNLIGPRPLIVKDLQHLTNAQLKTRHIIKPGILGLWQIKRQYKNDLDFYRYDLLYHKNYSINMDFYILHQTFFYLLKLRGR